MESSPPGTFLIKKVCSFGFSFFGDLIQSYFKRLNFLKDSGNFIPGHGGFFDRFDSFLLAIIPISILNLLF